MHAVSIDFAELEYAFGDQRVYAQHAWYLDRTTGDLVLFTEEKPDLTRFIYVPPRPTHETLGDMRAFTATVADVALRARLLAALAERGALRSFKDALLGAPEERARWIDYEREQMRATCTRWLSMRGISFTSRRR